MAAKCQWLWVIYFETCQKDFNPSHRTAGPTGTSSPSVWALPSTPGPTPPRMCIRGHVCVRVPGDSVGLGSGQVSWLKTGAAAQTRMWPSCLLPGLCTFSVGLVPVHGSKAFPTGLEGEEKWRSPLYADRESGTLPVLWPPPSTAAPHLLSPRR